MNKNRISFRNARLEDADRLLEIYDYYVRNTAITFEWDTPSVEEFKRRIAMVQEKYPYILALADDKIVGYAYVHPFVGRKAYEWSVETTIYLDPGIQKQGVGKALYLTMEEILKRMHILNLNACIGFPRQEDKYLTSNSADFHQHLGYELAGRFHNSGYKFGNWYDMIWMEKMIGEHLDHPEPVLNYHDISESLIGTLLSE